MDKNLNYLYSENHAGVLQLYDGRRMNYGSIRVENGNAVFYTGMGLREIWTDHKEQADIEKAKALKQKTEAELIESGHIKVLPISQIQHLVS